MPPEQDYERKLSRYLWAVWLLLFGVSILSRLNYESWGLLKPVAVSMLICASAFVLLARYVARNEDTTMWEVLGRGLSPLKAPHVLVRDAVKRVPSLIKSGWSAIREMLPLRNKDT